MRAVRDFLIAARCRQPGLPTPDADAPAGSHGRRVVKKEPNLTEGNPVDPFLAMLAEADKIVQAKYPGSKLYEADGKPAGTATQPADVTKWRFVFDHPVPHSIGHTVFLENNNGQFGTPADVSQPWLGDVIIPLPIQLGLDEAIRLKDHAGFTDPFSAVVLRWPLYPGVNEPSYIFSEPSRRLHVFVGVYSKRVTSEQFRTTHP